MYIRYNILGKCIYIWGTLSFSIGLIQFAHAASGDASSLELSSSPNSLGAGATQPGLREVGHLVGGRITKQQSGHMFLKNLNTWKKVSGV